MLRLPGVGKEPYKSSRAELPRRQQMPLAHMLRSFSGDWEAALPLRLRAGMENAAFFS